MLVLTVVLYQLENNLRYYSRVKVYSSRSIIRLAAGPQTTSSTTIYQSKYLCSSPAIYLSMRQPDNLSIYLSIYLSNIPKSSKLLLLLPFALALVAVFVSRAWSQVPLSWSDELKSIQQKQQQQQRQNCQGTNITRRNTFSTREHSP